MQIVVDGRYGKQEDFEAIQNGFLFAPENPINLSLNQGVSIQFSPQYAFVGVYKKTPAPTFKWQADFILEGIEEYSKFVEFYLLIHFL